MYRNPDTLKPVEYYCKLPPDCAGRDTFLIDPMLATGGTASAAAAYLKRNGVSRIKLLCLVCCPQGVNKMLEEHPDVDIYTAALDPELRACLISPYQRLFGEFSALLCQRLLA